MHKISISEITGDLGNIDKLILSLEHSSDTNHLTIPMLKQYQRAYDKFSDKYIKDPSFKKYDEGLFKPGELQALIFLAQGNEHLADVVLKDAKHLKKPGEEWVSETARKWDIETDNMPDLPYEAERKYSGKLEGLLAWYSLNFIVVPGFLLYDIFVNAPQLKNTISELSSSLADGFQSYYNYALTYDVMVLLFLAILGYFFFTKQRATRKLAISFGFFVLIGSFIAYSKLSNLATQSGATLGDSSGSFVTLGAIIWPFYWIFSKRVKETFVN